MIRVLQLLGVEADFQTRSTHENLSRHLKTEFLIESKTIGRGGDYPNIISAIRHLRHSNADILHAWGLPALTIATIAGTKRIVFSPQGFAGKKAIGWVRSIMGYANVQMICAALTQRRIARENGIMPSRCHLIRPGVDIGRIRDRQDDTLRTSLGLKEDDFVLLAPGESTRSAAHDDSIWAAGILHVLDSRYKLLLWGEGDQAAAAAQLLKKIRQPDMMKVANRLISRRLEFEELLPAADCCLITAKAPVATLPIAMCMAAGLPIVSTVTHTISELLEDRHTALMVSQSSPRLLAQRILDLRADSNLRRSVSDMAYTKAHEFFPFTRQLDQHRVMYEQFANDGPVNLTEHAAGAGPRFQGRA